MKKHSSFLIDVIIISSLILLISSYILECDQSSCLVLIDRVKFFPWTDYSENLVGGINISRGDKFGYDFSQPHFPGIYLYLGLIFKLVGLNNIIPSELLAYLSMVASSLGMMLIVLFFYKIVYGDDSGYIIAILIFLTLHMNTTFMMSETVAFWLTIPLITSLIRYLESNIFGIEILLLPVVITFSGLGFWGIAIIPYMAIIFKEKNRLIKFIINERKKFLIFTLTCIFLFSLGSLGISSIKDLYYWSVDINRVIRPNYFLNIQNSFIDWFANQDFNLRLINVFSVLFVILIIKIKGLVSKQSAIFMIIMAVTIIWRESSGYKVFPLLSIIIGAILFIYLNKEKKEIIFFNNHKLKFMIFAVAVAVAVLFLNNSINRISDKQIGYSYFSDEDLCRVNSSNKCLCVQVLVFGPQSYLFNDIKQCKSQMNTWADRLGTSNQYLRIVNNSIEKKEGAYLIPPDEYTKGDAPLLSIIEKIKDTYSCIPKANGFLLCKGDL